MKLVKKLFGAVAATFITFSAHAISPQQIINSASPDCMDWIYFGTYYGCKLVNHWIPVAYVEVTAGYGVTFVAGNRPPLTKQTFSMNGISMADKTASTQQSYMDNTSDVGALLVTQKLWKDSIAARSHTNYICTVDDANFQLTPIERMAIAKFTRTTPDCRAPDNNSYFGGDLAGYLKKGYTTTGDVKQWRTGCRDKPASELMMQQRLRCDYGLNIGDPLSPEACMGLWGPVYPRQIREIGLTQILASAKTAMRGVSNGRDAGDIPFPIDPLTKISQVQPNASQCMMVGTPSLMGVSELMAGFGLSQQGNYGYLVWRNVTCCARSSSADTSATN
jgi:hypothetical protein